MGTSDCERIGEGLLGQPVNTFTSLAYVAIGALLLRRALVSRSPALVSRSPALVVYATTVVAVGIGSAAFHGPMPSWGGFAHDFSIAAVLAFVIAYDVALVRDAGVQSALVGFAVLLGVCGIVLAIWPDASNALDAVLVVGAVIAEVAVARSPRRLASLRGLLRAPALWILGGAVLAIGAALNALGRTDAPLCDPDSLVQLHGAWHVLTAALLWVYGARVLEPREQARRIIPA